MLELIWLIPLFPVAGVLINGFFGRRMPRQAVGVLASVLVLLPFLVGVGAVLDLSHLPSGERLHEVEIGSWMPLGVASEGGETQYVWVVDPGEMTVHRREVGIGQVTGTGSLEILNGLEAGDRVVVAGVSHLSEGRKIRLMDE